MSHQHSTIDAIDDRHETSDLHPSETLRTYWIVFWWLMALLVLTVAVSWIHLDEIIGGLNLIVALIIATVKGSLVLLFFMHVKRSSKLTWIFATAAFLWLIIMIALSFNDYLTRDNIKPAMKTTPDQAREVTQERVPVPPSH